MSFDKSMGRTSPSQNVNHVICLPIKPDRCILAAQSIPLRAMFEGAFKEGSEDVITLRGVEPSSFGLLLDFLYDRSIEINVENVEALLDLSARYCVSLLRRHCCVFVARSADSSNACLLLAVADRYDCHRLRKRLLVYTLEVCCLIPCVTWMMEEGLLFCLLCAERFVRKKSQAYCTVES